MAVLRHRSNNKKIYGSSLGVMPSITDDRRQQLNDHRQFYNFSNAHLSTIYFMLKVNREFDSAFIGLAL